MSETLEKFEQIEPNDFRDFHSVNTVQMGELMYEGLINFDDGSWVTTPSGTAIEWYNDEQRIRFWNKFSDYYYYREIGELPYKRWKNDVLSKCALLMPKYKMLYEILDNIENPLQTLDEYGKLRYINSNFPQTLLSGNSDYASDGTDREHENIKLDDYTKKINELLKLDAIDFALIKEFEPLFYCLFTTSINGL